MKKVIYLLINVSFFLPNSLNSHVINSQEREEKTGIKRNTLYNREEIKVRWKKAALENCDEIPCLIAPSFTCGNSTIIDMDGNTYTTVSVGTQCWAVENLKVRKYNDGTAIPIESTGGADGLSTIWQNLTTGAYTIYGNELSSGTNATNYGFLYNWYASKGISTIGSTSYKNICPAGWHVPTDDDWTTIIQYIDPTSRASTAGIQSTTAGGKLKSTSTLWNSANPTSLGTDNFGFTALPGGFRNTSGSFSSISYSAFFWSVAECDYFGAWYRALFFNVGYVDRFTYNFKSVGASVRCIRN